MLNYIKFVVRRGCLSSLIPISKCVNNINSINCCSRHLWSPRGTSTAVSNGISFEKGKKKRNLNNVISDAEKIVGYPTSFMNLRYLLSDEMSNVALYLKKLVGTKHPLLETARNLLLDGKNGMQTRGLIVLLMSKAAGVSKSKNDHKGIVGGIYNSQRSLAEIIEMIHTAYHIHQGIVDLKHVKCMETLTDMAFGNKIAILSGDFLLATACSELASLHNTKVIEIISGVISDLMEAEFVADKHLTSFDSWINHTELAFCSIIAKSCQAALDLAGHSHELQHQAFRYGKQLAFAHKLHQDLQPFLNPSDIYQGFSLSSAPAIIHLEKNKSIDLSSKSNQNLYEEIISGPSINICKTMCNEHGNNALKALDFLNNSEAKQALEDIVHAVAV